jgi:thiamine pyrophosphate-dependent acetolactate synthase large subunit-like protein
VADAFLDRAPLVALTGQSDLKRMHKESHQYIDLIGILYPIVKWNARVSSPEIVSEVVRKAFGLPAWRCSNAEDFPRLLRDALAKDVPSVIVVPIDYSIDVAISETLGAETVAT